MADEARAAAYRDEMDELLASGCAKADEVFAAVVDAL